MKKLKSLIVTTMFLVSLLVVLNPVSAATHHVYPGGSIQIAVTNANPGDTIYVHAGTYFLTSSITINKNLTLIGDGAAVTTIDGSAIGGGPPAPALDVSFAAVNIGGFTITNANPCILYQSGASGIIRNNVILAYGNFGICNVSSSPAIMNNTITPGPLGGATGISNTTNSNPTITNNIVSSNISMGIFDDGTSTSICTYNDVWNNGTNYFNAAAGVGSISADPKLNGSYHLSGSSPCIDAGIDTGLVYTDMDGDSRPQGMGFDIGADEYVPPAINPIVAFAPVASYHLTQVNRLLLDIEELLPEDVPADIQELLDKAQEHIDNANTTANTIYANNELLKALELLNKALNML